MLNGMKVFGGAVWDGNPESAMRVPTSAEAQERVLTALLETPLDEQPRNLRDWFVSLIIHTVIVTAVVVVPLLFTQAIDLQKLKVTYLVAPAPPSAPPPPASAIVQKMAPRKIASLVPAKLTVPFLIPRKIVVAHDADPAPDISGGVIGGIPGGVPGGVLGGIIGDTSAAPPAPSSAAAPAKKEILRVGGNVKPPKLLFGPQPKYPILARHAHIEGEVIVNAIVDEEGNVINARAVTGPPLLIPEALRTILLWKYEPTYLNGVAYPIALTATLTFSLGS